MWVHIFQQFVANAVVNMHIICLHNIHLYCICTMYNIPYILKVKKLAESTFQAFSA